MKVYNCTLLAVLAILTEGTAQSNEELRSTDLKEKSVPSLTSQRGDVTRHLVSYFWYANDILGVGMEDNQTYNRCSHATHIFPNCAHQQQAVSMAEK